MIADIRAPIRGADPGNRRGPPGRGVGEGGLEGAPEHFGSQRGLLQMIPQGLPIGTVRSSPLNARSARNPSKFQRCEAIADCFDITFGPPFVDMTPSDYNLRLTILELSGLRKCGPFKVSRFHPAKSLLVLANVRERSSGLSRIKIGSKFASAAAKPILSQANSINGRNYRDRRHRPSAA